MSGLFLIAIRFVTKILKGNKMFQIDVYLFYRLIFWFKYENDDP